MKEKELCYCRIDRYWAKVSAVVDDNGNKKFDQLFALVRCVLSVSHGNAFPERGFSINKFLLERHGNSCNEDTIVALRAVKDELCRVGGVLKFPFTKGLRSFVVDNARTRYFADGEERKRIMKEEEKRQREEENMLSAQEKKNKAEFEEIDLQLERLNSQLQAANEIIEEGHSKLEEELKSKCLDRNKLQAANSKIEIGLDRKRKLEGQIDSVQEKKRKLK